MNELNIYLIGGNSTIGQAILKGVEKKYRDSKKHVTSFIRNKYDDLPPGECIQVNEYKEALNWIVNQSKKTSSKTLVIVSFGVLREEIKAESFQENIKFHLDINTFKTKELLDQFATLENVLEIHIVSSILADFIRPSIYSYSISKKMLELFIKESINKEIYKSKLFIWKPAFVKSRLNQNREPSFIKTNPLNIEKIVSKKYVSGSYYIPSYSIIFTKIAKFSSPFIKLLDKK
tara:strand:- start:8655 stop:9353 length:699 start_codon:yes stop_codon:yes gene_type:complete